MGRGEVLTGVERRRVRTDEDKLQILEEVETTVSSVTEIAGRHDILPQKICIWREKLGRDIRSPGGSGVTLLPVELVGADADGEPDRAAPPRQQNGSHQNDRQNRRALRTLGTGLAEGSERTIESDSTWQSRSRQHNVYSAPSLAMPT